MPPVKAIYGGLPDKAPGSFDGELLAFAEDLRSEGMAVGTSEMLDAFAALALIRWESPSDFKETLATTIAKSPDDRRVFDLVFERFFFRAAEAQAVRLSVSEPQSRAGSDELDLEALRRQIAQALEDGSESELRDLARLAIAAFGKGEGSGVLGVDVQRIRRALGLRTEPQPDLPSDDPRHDGLPREQLRRFEQHLRRELERGLIERTQALPPKRPLTDLDRSLPGGPVQDLAAVHKVVAQLRRRLATQGHELRGAKRHAHVDVRATMRASLQTGGVPVELKYRPKPPTPTGAVRALRRLNVGDQRLDLLPQRPARTARCLPQAAFVRVHRADLRGHGDLPARARLPRCRRLRCRRMPASPTSPGTRITAASGPNS